MLKISLGPHIDVTVEGSDYDLPKDRGAFQASFPIDKDRGIAGNVSVVRLPAGGWIGKVILADAIDGESICLVYRGKVDIEVLP